MLKHIQWISIVLLLLFSAFSYHKISNYKEEVETLTQEKKVLTEQVRDAKSQSAYILSQNSQLDSSITYQNWPEYFDLAEVMVEESNGKFKRPWAVYLVKEAQKYNIDPFLVYELLRVETGATFDPELVGPETKYGHAYGMAQFMKNTAPWIADMADLPYQDELLYDPYYSITLSIVYLDYLHDQYENWDETLTAYHRGMAGMEQYKLQKGHANSQYARTIQTKAEKHVAMIPQ
ncbi:transglycosylase SLT domain-containing protein [Gracilibacillus sp. YIM 98692]|uniref:lytic transglycosylase domain-containing protein n=1 Tax=Gracilibacillus sp. YIM 98692 TaxID=2663532 RepID=UPI001F0911B1|nr:transglycosylase SLT domain-containing protein [Gracilibacillus sp. YIM 98692]